MKKLYISILFSIVTLCSFAQSNENYDGHAVGTTFGNPFNLGGIKYTIIGAGSYTSSIENNAGFSPLGNNGTDRYLLFDKNNTGGASSIKIELQSGGQFSLSNISIDGLADGNITINSNKGGTPLSYSSNSNFITYENINTSANSNFQNITSVTISGGNILLSIDDLQFTTVLPVTLANYSLKNINNGDIELNWSTVSEPNNSHFVIEHSLNAVDYTLVEKVSTKGNTANNYKYTYKYAQAGTNYFKLLQVDNDGRSKELDVKAINIGLNGNNWNVFPNPIIDKFTISIAAEDNVKSKAVKLYSISGKEVYSAVLPIEDGNIKVLLPTKPASGVYMVNVDGIGTKSMIIK